VTYSTLEVCSSRGGFEAVPRPRLLLDLAAIAARLRERGVPVTDARVMLLVTLECEATLARDGRILLKTPDAEVAARTFAALAEAAGLPHDGPAEARPAPSIPERLIPP